jgi:hypothetical protein
MNSQLVSSFTNSDSSVFKDWFLLSVHIFIRFAYQWKSQVIAIFGKAHTTFEILKIRKSYFLPIFYFPKATFNILKVFIAFFSTV